MLKVTDMDCLMGLGRDCFLIDASSCPPRELANSRRLSRNFQTIPEVQSLKAIISQRLAQPSPILIVQCNRENRDNPNNKTHTQSQRPSNTSFRSRTVLVTRP
jgi:hypothetical protein